MALNETRRSEPRIPGLDSPEVLEVAVPVFWPFSPRAGTAPVFEHCELNQKRMAAGAALAELASGPQIVAVAHDNRRCNQYEKAQSDQHLGARAGAAPLL